MTVRKPLDKPPAIDIDALIEKGAKVKSDQVVDEKKSIFIRLRIPFKMLTKIDEALANRVGISRTGWILEAIDEKVKNER